MLAKRCRHDFEQITTSRGRDYFQSHRVSYVNEKRSGVSADVDGNNGEAYIVEVNWRNATNGTISSTCTCPHFQDGFLCKHIWAVFLELDKRGMSTKIPGGDQLSVLPSEESGHASVIVDEEDEFDDDFEESVAEVVQSLPASDIVRRIFGQNVGDGYAKFKPSREQQEPRGWRRQINQIAAGVRQVAEAQAAASEPTQRVKQIFYVVNVADSQRQNCLVFDFLQRPLKKNGDWGKLRPYSVPRYRLDEVPDPVDRELLGMLVSSDMRQTVSSGSYYYGYSSNYSSTIQEVWIAPSLAEMILPKLCATQRCVWALNSQVDFEQCEPVVWDSSDIWRIGLEVVSDAAAKHWVVRGQIGRGDQQRRLTEAVLLNSHIVLFPETCGRVQGDLAQGWGSVLRSESAMLVPYEDRVDFLDRLARFTNVPPADWPLDMAIDFVDGEPKGILRINRTQLSRTGPYWFCHVLFDYGLEQFSVRDERGGVYDPQGELIVRRNLEVERKLLEQLDAAQAKRPTDFEFNRTEADRKIHDRHLSDFVEAMTVAGWQVEAEGVKIRRPGAVRLSVSSAVDWFELDGEVDFDGVAVSLPSLLKAVRNEQKYVLLGDGTRGLLPEEWLRKYGRLAELGDADGDSVRFATSQAMLLDALLAAQEAENVAYDEQFDQFRQRLRTFQGIEAANAPEQFQGTLREYQREGLGWLHFLREFNLGGCLADDMGLGKTVQVLALLESRRQQRAAGDKEIGPSLVIVPKSLVFNWVEEASRFTPEMRVLNYTGLLRRDELDNFDQYDIVVTTYGTLRRDIVDLKERQFDYAILDESQAIKNAGSQAAKAVRLLNARHRLAMTGTPVENHLGELWSLFEFLNPGMLGRSSAFSAMSRTGGGEDNGEWLGVLAQALRPFLLRRTKRQVLTELPEKTEQTLYCEMSSKERKKYDELRDYYRSQLNDRVAQHGLQKSKIHVLEALLRLRQAACHPGLLDSKLTGETSAKLETLFDQLDEIVEEGHKALVFSQFTSLLAIVKDHLDKKKVVYEYLDGRTRKRGERVKRFQEDPDCPLFLISLKAGGHGLNLTAADYVFILDPWWNPAVEAQAVDRAHRIGQTRHVFAYRLICKDTVEDKIIELQKSKRELADAIVSADDSLLRSLTAEDLAMLFE
ncbi:MAG: SNF2-related protein [Pirellulaceae bacterium]